MFVVLINRPMDTPNKNQVASSNQLENFYISNQAFAEISEEHKEKLKAFNVVLYEKKKAENPKISEEEKELLQIFVDTEFLYQVQKYKSMEQKYGYAANNFIPKRFRFHTYELACKEHQDLKPKKWKLINKIGVPRANFIFDEAQEKIKKEMAFIGM